MLLLATGARAEVTHMNCKFNEGWHKKGGYREDAMKFIISVGAVGELK